MRLMTLAARLLIGGLFVGHGTQKLKGWFGGPGIEGTAGWMGSIDMHPPRRNAIAAGVTETAGGALLALGLATPLAAAALSGVMITAIRKVHLPNGPWATKGGYEYNVVLIAAALLIAEEGPGPVSLDAVLGTERKGTRWAIGALALAAAASTATIELGRRNAPAAPAAPESPAMAPDAEPAPAR
jgi:putative oxidoreductase